MFSRRTDHEREPNEIARALSRARDEGRVLVDLTAGNPTELGLGLDAEAILRPLQDGASVRYAPTALGRLETRRAVADSLGVPAERILLTASTSEAYAFAFATFCDPGDRVLVPRPSYPLLEWIARYAGVTLDYYDLAYDGEWYVDAASLDRALASPARCIVAVSPNNPTGSVLDRETRDALLDRGLPLVIDEVFAGFPLDGDAASLPPATRGIELRLSGISKQLALPQMKLGFTTVSGAPELVAETMQRLSLLSDTFLSTSTPIELALPSWLAHGPAVRAQIGERCRTNLRTLDAALEDSAATRLRADAGWYAVVRVPEVADEDTYCAELLAHGVVVQPGWYFDFVEGAHLVLSLLPKPEDFVVGASHLANIVRTLSSR